MKLPYPSPSLYMIQKMLNLALPLSLEEIWMDSIAYKINTCTEILIRHNSEAADIMYA